MMTGEKLREAAGLLRGHADQLEEIAARGDEHLAAAPGAPPAWLATLLALLQKILPLLGG